MASSVIMANNLMGANVGTEVDLSGYKQGQFFATTVNGWLSLKGNVIARVYGATSNAHFLYLEAGADTTNTVFIPQNMRIEVRAVLTGASIKYTPYEST